MTTTQLSSPAPVSQQPERDPAVSIADRVQDLLDCMTLEEKLGQMTLVEKNSIDPDTVRRLGIGGVLSGGGGYPPDNSPAGWLEMVNSYVAASRQTRLGIPLLYGVDAVHGHNNVRGAVIFPHNIGLGATGDAGLLRRIGRATAVETYATGIRWNYAPTITVPQDLRWGRTYEGYAEDPDLVTRLGLAYFEGMQRPDLTAPFSVLATPKHYVGDGGTTWGTSTKVFEPVPVSGYFDPTPFYIDQGDTHLDEVELRRLHLAPYLPLLQAGALTVMASFSSWNGAKLHTHRYLLTGVLKGELGFSGFIVTDWAGIEDLSAEHYQNIVASINAGIDMNMVPVNYDCFLSNIQQAVENGDIPLERIDDAVRRILTVKMQAGLFDRPDVDDRYLSFVGSAAHRDLAREAVAKSLVLLKNEQDLLPLSKSTPHMLVAGAWADDLGRQCGGWSIEWQGGDGTMTAGVTILEAMRATVSAQTVIEYDARGLFAPGRENAPMAELGLVVIGEKPYAEGFGDREDLTLDEAGIALIERMRGQCRKLVVMLVTGRPLIITAQLPLIDALVAAWLPGSEGQGVADVLFGDVPFQGRLSYTWPRSMDQVPRSKALAADPLFPFGYGLT